MAKKKTEKQKIWGKHRMLGVSCDIAAIAAFDQDVAYNIRQIALAMALRSDSADEYDRCIERLSDVVSWCIKDAKMRSDLPAEVPFE